MATPSGASPGNMAILRSAQADEPISAGEMAALGTHLLIPTTLMFLPTTVIRIAFQDAWISIILGFGLTLALAAILLPLLAHAAPGQGLLEALQLRAPWIARLLGLVFGFALVHLEALVVIEIGIFWQQVVMPETPDTFFAITALVLAALSARAGIEPLGRTALLFAGILLIFTPIVLLMSFNLIHPAEFQPVLANGMKPVAVATQPVLGFGEELLLLALGLGYLRSRPGSSPVKASFQVMALATGISLGVTVLFFTATIAALGPREASRDLLPALTYMHLIRLGEFIQRIEGVVLLFWTWSILTKTALVHLLACQAWGAVFTIRDARVLSLPLVGLVFAESRILIRDTVELVHYLMIWGLIATTFFLLPLLIGLVAIRLTPSPNRPAPPPNTAAPGQNALSPNGPSPAPEGQPVP